MTDLDAIARLERSHAPRAGEVDLGSGKKQHVDLFRKLGLRRELLGMVGEGAAYVPFLGEADIAVELYLDRRIVGVELDPDIARQAADRLLDALGGRRFAVITGDAEVWHQDVLGASPFAVLDIDAFSNPYIALETAWRNMIGEDNLAQRVAIFGTDGMRLAIRRSKTRMLAPLPLGKPLLTTDDINERRRQWNGWYIETVRPYLADLIAPGTIVADRKYLRDHMLYWGVVVDRTTSATDDQATARAIDEWGKAEVAALPAPPADATPEDIATVEAALLEAARSGNVPAAIFWLEHKGGTAWRAMSGRSRLDEIIEEHER